MNNILKNATMVDVRTEAEFAEGHYPGAINIPLDKIPENINEFRKMKMPVVAYCRSGNRSGMAVSLLREHGIYEVYNGGALEDLLALDES
ncbi:MAG: rhodanese-like domain-containing protein [Flavisolibacter sp.]